mmetsp:Transcript_12493/g.19324  ORF Transcript_12493/g.19324 Transcript_12493/m.19324 type:complete len:490 (-) Transcript_12493:1536-3005(-)|eukprot:CAMPEP_0195281342 /NCGR_PEP_ID=MMETSP0707-20130614/692_1 /TAXON_ID=33640 /ORGANISM="Asterionellopsis glacialis, Strain CCMP134" /LENGTH=489 /DNA_ID=CAMNT_0040340221 /DNA_START=10 /DNA_END=1479 /DNA_ORIENTATION=-
MSNQRLARARMQMRNRCAKLPGCDKLRQRPNGVWSVFPIFFVTLAWFMGMAATSVCSFVERTVSAKDVVNDEILKSIGKVFFQSAGIGFWGWEHNNVCLKYSIRGHNPSFDVMYKMSNAFTAMASVFGGMVMVFLWLGFCFPVKVEQYKVFGSVLLCSSIMSIATLCIMGSSVCDPAFFSYIWKGLSSSEGEEIPDFAELIDSSCKLSTGATLSIVASICYLVAAVICFRPPQNNLRSEHSRRLSQQQYPSFRMNDRFDDEDDDNDEPSHNGMDDEAARLYAQRKEETQRRYQEMFGDEGDDGDDDEDEEEEVVLPFKTMRPTMLATVDEGSKDNSNHATSQRVGSDTARDSSLHGIDESMEDQHYNPNQQQQGGGGGYSDDGSRSNYSQDNPRSFYSESERQNSGGLHAAQQQQQQYQGGGDYESQGDDQSRSVYSEDRRGPVDTPQYNEEASRSYYSDDRSRSHYDEHSRQSRSPMNADIDADSALS